MSHNSVLRRVVICFCLLAGVSVRAAVPLTYYVSPQGDGAWSGTRPTPNASHTDGPFATLDQARDRIEAFKKRNPLPPGGVRVIVRGGTYFLGRPFSLTAPDGGDAAHPVVYEAALGETVRLTGGRPVTGWAAVTDPAVLARLDLPARSHVLQADLKGLGMTDYGQITRRGFGLPITPAGLELFYADMPMPLARWPNQGQWATIVKTPDGQNGGAFTVDSDRLRRWQNAQDVWVHGYWSFDWADTYEKVASVNPAQGEIRTAPPHGAFGYSPGHRFYVLNVLEELDAPGEWYLDRQAARLYFWPPAPVSQGVVVSLGDTLLSLQDTSCVTVRGLTLEDCRGTAAVIAGGDHTQIVGCTLRNIGNIGVVVRGGADNGVRGCSVSETGDGGIVLEGGDRAHLTPARNFAANNRIFHYSRWSRTYRPAVQVDGDGNIVTHNLIHDAPHDAIQLSGNDHLIEFNEIHHVAQEAGDVGGFYMGRDWTQRGNVIRYNYFHDLGGASGLVGYHDVMAIYLDDLTSGTTVYGNVCVNVEHAVQVGGGRDNRIENNIFVNCRTAISLDARGMDWAAKSISPGGDWHMQEKLKAVRWDQPPYSIRYPALATILRDDPAVPTGNVVARNIAVGCHDWLNLQTERVRKETRVEKNISDTDPRFVDLAKRDFRLERDSPALRLGFLPIPFAQIGVIVSGNPGMRKKAGPETPRPPHP